MCILIEKKLSKMCCRDGHQVLTHQIKVQTSKSYQLKFFAYMLTLKFEQGKVKTIFGHNFWVT